jgi:hypothetical protein
VDEETAVNCQSQSTVWGRGGAMNNIFVRGEAMMALKYIDGDEDNDDKI